MLVAVEVGDRERVAEALEEVASPATPVLDWCQIWFPAVFRPVADPYMTLTAPT